MSWYDTLETLIDFRSFSSIWYWIVVAVVWSTASHWVLGVPFDMIHRARRKGGPSMEDLEQLVAINVRRITYILDVSGTWIVAFTAFILTILAVLGWVYRVEIAQAVFLLAVPMSVVGLSIARTARAQARAPATDEALIARLNRLRFAIRFVGLFAILTTAFWGMWQNLYISGF